MLRRRRVPDASAAGHASGDRQLPWRCRSAGPGTRAQAQDRNCLVLTNWTTHLDKLADVLRGFGRDPVVLRGGMGARQRAAALARLQPQTGGPPLLAIATGSYAGEGSTARRSTHSSSPRPSRRREDSSSTPGGSFAPTTGRPPPKSTTTTTSSPASSPYPLPSGPPATPASASPTPASFLTHPAQPGRPMAEGRVARN
jgi:hypothetical protein